MGAAKLHGSMAVWPVVMETGGYVFFQRASDLSYMPANHAMSMFYILRIYTLLREYYNNNNNKTLFI